MVERFMELRRLRYFVAVAEEMQFGRAADRLGMAQQPLSVQIKLLEKELGCKLFEREANRIRLTAAGEVLLREARALVAQTATAVELTQRAARGEVGILRLSHCSAALRHVVPVAIRSLKDSYPDIGVALQEMGWAAQIAALQNGEIDVGFMYRPLVDERRFAILDMHEDGFVVALPATHRFANAASVAPRSLTNEPFVAMSPKFNACAARTTEILRDGDVDHAVAYEVADKTSALGLVGNGMGFTILPELAALPFPNVVYRPLETALRMRLAAVWSRKTALPIMQQRFIETLRGGALTQEALR